MTHHQKILNKFGWKTGIPPNDDKNRLAFVWYWPLHPKENREGTFPTFEGGYICGADFFMRTDGWIGWRCICVCYHPAEVIPVGDGPYFVNNERWNHQVLETLK